MLKDQPSKKTSGPILALQRPPQVTPETGDLVVHRNRKDPAEEIELSSFLVNDRKLMSTSQNNDFDLDQRREADLAREWRERFVEEGEPSHLEERLYAESDAFGCGAISKFPGRNDRTLDFYARVLGHVRRFTGTDFDGFSDGRPLFDETVKESFVCGHEPPFAALRFVRLMTGEVARTLSVPVFHKRNKQRFLQVGTEPGNWDSDAALFTGGELHQELYHAEAGPDRVREEAEWPEHPGETFAPTDALELVRLR